jgi:TRAP-type C4-dicarboxylate transport system permease small subunit
MKLLLKLNDAVGKVENVLISVGLLSMLFLAFLQVIMRDVFNKGLPWADSIVRLLVLWVGFVGAALATKLDQNLTLEVLTKYMPERLRHLSSIVVKLFAIMVCYFLFRASLKFLGDEMTTGEEYLNLFPSWYTLTIFPATFVLIPFHLVIGIIKDVVYFVKGKPE